MSAAHDAKALRMADELTEEIVALLPDPVDIGLAEEIHARVLKRLWIAISTTAKTTPDGTS